MSPLNILEERSNKRTLEKRKIKTAIIACWVVLDFVFKGSPSLDGVYDSTSFKMCYTTLAAFRNSFCWAGIWTSAWKLYSNGTTGFQGIPPLPAVPCYFPRIRLLWLGKVTSRKWEALAEECVVNVHTEQFYCLLIALKKAWVNWAPATSPQWTIDRFQDHGYFFLHVPLLLLGWQLWGRAVSLKGHWWLVIVWSVE